MKKLIFVIATLFTTSVIFASAPPEVNEKVLTLFNETFKDPKEVNWHEYDNYYEVYFKEGDITFRIRYDTEGNILQYLRYYYEDQLPIHILSSLKKKYPDRSIFGVTEFFSGTELNYFITLKDDKHWYTIKSDNIGNLEQTEKLNKG